MKKLARMLVVLVTCVLATALVPELAYAQRGGRGAGNSAGPRSPSPRSGGTVSRAVPRRGVAPRQVRPYPRGRYGGRYIVGAYPYRAWYGWGSPWGWNTWGHGFYGSMWWPGWGWWGPPRPYYAVPYGVTSDARLLVTPRETEVYVDGALAGIVDNFDGVFQSLRLAPGTHEITLYLEGYRRHAQRVYVAPGATLKLRHTMEPLPAGAPDDGRPDPPAPPEPPRQEPPPPEPPATPRVHPGEPGARGVAPGDAAVLVIRVQPADAEVLIDGQRWHVPPDGRALEVGVPAGRVRVEVRKPGFASFATDVTVEPGVRTPVNVSLRSDAREI